MANLEVKVARNMNEVLHGFAVRSVVYMGGQDCPYDEEYDGNDFAGTSHIIAYYKGEPVGTMRIRWFAEFVKFERAAVLERFRGNRVRGEPVVSALLSFSLRYAGKRGYLKGIAHAQAHLAKLWSKFGFVERCGRPNFCFSDYDYVEMETRIEPPENAIHINTDPMKLNRPDGVWDEVGVLERSVTRSLKPSSNDVESPNEAIEVA